MGSYRFKWPHTADKVIVTGTFDGWGQKIVLENKGRYHEKVVPLAAGNQKILYKYVVNGQWRIDPSHAVERDHEGYENNVLDPEDIIADTAIMNSVGPGATTLGAGAYEKGAGGAAYSAAEKGDNSAAHFGKPPAGGTVIPQPSLVFASVGPGATTTLLAGEQPIEPRTGPQVLRKSDDKDDEVTTPQNIAGAPTATAATVPTATSPTGAPQLGDPTGGGLAPITMDDKPTSTPAATKAAQTAADVSDTTKPAGQPEVTTGVDESKTPQTSTPQKRQSIVDKIKSYGTPGSSPSSTPDSKKGKRRSFLGRIKDSFKP